MMNQDSTQAILSLKDKGIPIREISRILHVSRNTVRRVLRGKGQERSRRASRYEELAPLIQETLKRCKGNAVRVPGRSFWTPMGMKFPTVRSPGW